MPYLLPTSLRTQLVSMTEVFARGMRILVDRDGVLSRLASASREVPTWVRPRQDAFLDQVSRFWHGPVWTAKHLRRGEVWRAKDACDNRMKMPLLQMIEWHARIKRGSECETWALGRFIEEWADPRVIEHLGRAFARYEEEDVWRALLETMELFGWVAQETADGLGFRYPQALDREVTEWVQGLHAERAQNCRTE
jgi:aminoglycoside 6-adenylyltransferase